MFINDYRNRHLPDGYGAAQGKFRHLIFPTISQTSAVAINVPPSRMRHILPFIDGGDFILNTVQHTAGGGGLFDVVLTVTAHEENATAASDFNSGADTVTGVSLTAGTPGTITHSGIDAGDGSDGITTFDYEVQAVSNTTGRVMKVKVPILVPEG